MSLRALLGVLTALAILSVASVIGAGEASAHGGHAHHAIAAAAPSPADAGEIAVIEAELSKLGAEAGDAQADGAGQASNEQPPRACDGHCCGMAASSCCSLAPPAMTGAPALAPTRAAAIAPAHDGEREGLGPRSILRPPRVPA